MHEVEHTSSAFAERLREAVEESARTGPRGRHRASRSRQAVFSPVANPQRVRYSDELFVERVRKALD